MIELPSAEYLRECFDWDAERGRLTWRARPREHFKSHRSWALHMRVAGKPADTKVVHGYRIVTLNKVGYRAHRIIWKLATGEDPEVIDHINFDKQDNRLSNLRSCTMHENNFNRQVRVDNRSGFKGVHAFNGQWRAMIGFNGKSRHIGLFPTPEKAHEAYLQEAERLFGEFACA